MTPPKTTAPKRRIKKHAPPGFSKHYRKEGPYKLYLCLCCASTVAAPTPSEIKKMSHSNVIRHHKTHHKGEPFVQARGTTYYQGPIVMHTALKSSVPPIVQPATDDCGEIVLTDPRVWSERPSTQDEINAELKRARTIALELGPRTKMQLACKNGFPAPPF